LKGKKIFLVDLKIFEKIQKENVEFNDQGAHDSFFLLDPRTNKQFHVKTQDYYTAVKTYYACELLRTWAQCSYYKNLIVVPNYKIILWKMPKPTHLPQGYFDHCRPEFLQNLSNNYTGIFVAERLNVGYSSCGRNSNLKNELRGNSTFWNLFGLVSLMDHFALNNDRSVIHSFNPENLLVKAQNQVLSMVCIDNGSHAAVSRSPQELFNYYFDYNQSQFLHDFIIGVDNDHNWSCGEDVEQQQLFIRKKNFCYGFAEGIKNRPTGLKVNAICQFAINVIHNIYAINNDEIENMDVNQDNLHNRLHALEVILEQNANLFGNDDLWNDAFHDFETIFLNHFNQVHAEPDTSN